jgi:hypothetical protein
MVLDGEVREGILFKFGFVIISLWRHKHFDPAVLTDAG